MAMRKTANRKMIPPPVPVEERNGEIVSFPFFDPSAAEGFYKIDAFKRCFDASQEYQEIRMFVEQAAGFASMCASREVKSIEAYKFASTVIADLEKLQYAAKRLLKVDTEKFEELFNFGTTLTTLAAEIQLRESSLRSKGQLDAFAANRPYVAPPPSGKIISARTVYVALKDVEAKIEALLHDRKLHKRRVPSRSDPLARIFIEQMARFWKDRASSRVPGDQAAFIRFLAAAWEDLNFPNPVDRAGKPKPLLDWFEERVPKQLVKGRLRTSGI